MNARVIYEKLGKLTLAGHFQVQDKKKLSERDICTQYITRALQRSGWDFATQVREEVSFTKGRVAEQHRIVAKVDELKALCDHLQAGLSESRLQQERLATTLIESALKTA